jgi:hypothetical protein
MPGLAAKVLLLAALLAAPGAGVAPEHPAGAPPKPPAAPARPQIREAPLSPRALGDAAFAADSGGFLAGGPERPRLVERWWAGIRSWAEAEFDRHGMAAARTLSAAARRLDPELEVSALPLGGGAVLVSATRYTHGTAFILGPQGGHMRTLWTIAAPDAAARRAFPVLASWSAGAVVGLGCGDDPCRAIGVNDIGLLPAGRNNAVRFFVHGTYYSETGATMGGHLAIWEWDGRSARPLFARHFTFMAAQEAPVLTVQGGDLLLHVKDDFRHFYACGSCEGRQMAWRLRVEPDGVRDLGRTSLLPEVDFIDTLIDRVARGDDAAALSAPAPVAMLRARIADARGFARDAGISDDPVQLGMLMRWRATGTGARRELCLATDHDVATIFTLARTGGSFRLLAARELGGAAADRDRICRRRARALLWPERLSGRRGSCASDCAPRSAPVPRPRRASGSGLPAPNCRASDSRSPALRR